jgi:ABC-2 type transport system permease protein
MNNVTATDPDVLQDLRGVLASRIRPKRASALSASHTFFWRAMVRIKRAPEQVIDVLLLPVVFTLVFTYMFGGALAGSTTEYLTYLLPGTLVMTLVLVTTATGSNLNSDIAKGVFDRFRSLPIWSASPLIGAWIGDLVRYFMAAFVVLAMGFAMGYRPGGSILNVLAAVGLVLAFSLSLSWIWNCIGLMARNPSTIQTVGTIVLFPLSFASNVFVSPDTMPSWLRAFVNVNPISHLVTAVRGLMEGSPQSGEITAVLVSCTVILAIFMPLAAHLYRRKSI